MRREANSVRRTIACCLPQVRVTSFKGGFMLAEVVRKTELITRVSCLFKRHLVMHLQRIHLCFFPPILSHHMAFMAHETRAPTPQFIRRLREREQHNTACHHNTLTTQLLRYVILSYSSSLTPMFAIRVQIKRWREGYGAAGWAWCLRAMR